MNPFSSMLLLLFFSNAPFGEPAERSFPFWSPRHTGSTIARGDPALKATRLESKGSCLPKRLCDPGKAEPRSTPPLLCKPQEDSQVQLGQGIHPARSRAISVPQGSLLVEREKDLSAYNWNSFGLRYGKRQADTREAKVKIL
uniref:KiSS-1 metastasis suppressor n=1 Tax=Chrysemys picta bellii TaxID=8478 RepID=A0A8C3HVY0_CHRPI